jgi:broad specificity phosphatase PhoE
VGQGHEPRSLRPLLTGHSPTGVYLARHGQTAYNKEGRFQGQQQVPLDDTGRAQAAELAERAAGYGFCALWCSPLRRARETADAVAETTGLQPREDARFMETDAGDWTDRSFADVIAEAPELFASFANAEPDFAFPGGESFVAQEARVGAALDDVEKAKLPALVVCHGMVIRAALSVRVGRWLPEGQRVPNGALVPLEPSEAELAALGRGGATQAS